MNQNEFVKALNDYLTSLENQVKVGDWTYSYQENRHIFEQNTHKYFLTMEVSHSKSPCLSLADAKTGDKMIMYLLSKDNYMFDAKRGVIFGEDNYHIPFFSKEALRQKMLELGWKENPIFETKVAKMAWAKLLNDILDWAIIRKKAENNLLLERHLDKKIALEETVNIAEEEKPMYQKNMFPLNQILYGPSGTGKTYSTISKSVAIADQAFFQQHQQNYAQLKIRYEELQKEGKIAFITFHQNYSYEDFVQGIKPDISAKNLKFEKKEGIFKKLSNKALANTLQNYVLIIDEINRANISRVFGELISLIEEDKRWGNAHQMTTILPNGEPFTVPKNLYLIGTMNTADKSIALLDIALRRRFAFEYMPPLYENFVDDRGIIFLKSLNKEILAKKGKDFLIGHAAFMKPDFDWTLLINGHIIPLLEEYFYTDKKGHALKKMLEMAILEAGLNGEILRNEWDILEYKATDL